MPKEIIINRQKLGIEDLAFGTGTETQTRGGQSVEITLINAANLPFNETQTLFDWVKTSGLEDIKAALPQITAVYNQLDYLATLGPIATDITDAVNAYLGMTVTYSFVPYGTPGSVTYNPTTGVMNFVIQAGPQGLKGDTGDIGPQGLKGDTGLQGLKGDTGPQGLTGLQGLKGDTGPQGLTGDTGPQGPQGLKGDTGDTGPQGPQGLKGDTGYSVDHIARTSGTGAAGTIDTYTAYADFAETLPLGSFDVYNGVDGIGVGDMLKSFYDTNNDGKVDNAENADTVNGLTVETAVPVSAIFTDTVISLVDTLTSTSTTEALTANQGKVLNGLVDAKLDTTNPSIIGSITEQVYNLTGTEINPVNGTIQYKTVSTNTTFTEALIAGQSVLLRLIDADSYTISFPTITWVGSAAPELTANCAIVIWKEQTTLYGAYVGTLV